MPFKCRFLCFAAVAAAFLLMPQGALAARERVPSASQIGEPLTLPKGKTELGFGGDIIQPQDGENWYLYPTVYARHGLTDDLELLPLGLRWRVVNLPAKGYQMAVKGRLAGVSDNTVGARSFTSWEFAAEGKLRVHDELAVTYYVGQYRSEYSGGYAAALDAGAGLLISLGPPAVVEVTYDHQWQEGLGRAANDAVGVSLYWNPEPGTQIYFATTSNLLTRNDAFRFYHLGNINQVYSLGVKWQF